MTNLNYIIENLNGRLSCDLFSNDGPERPLEVSLIILVQGRSKSFLLLVLGFPFDKRNGVNETQILTLPLITSYTYEMF